MNMNYIKNIPFLDVCGYESGCHVIEFSIKPFGLYIILSRGTSPSDFMRFYYVTSQIYISIEIKNGILFVK